MTQRSRPASRRTRASGRRTLYTNLFFAGVLVLALLILVIAAGVNYYSAHFAAIATINGHSVTKDDLKDRYSVDLWRYGEIESRLRDAVLKGLISKDLADQEIASLEQQKSTSGAILGQSLQSLVDAELQSQLAAKLDIVVTEQQIDDKLAQEATANEERHVWVIEFAPDVSTGATKPTDAQDTAALAKANGALVRLGRAEDWLIVARESTTVGDQSGGDQGFISKAQSNLDPALLDQVFSLPLNGQTGVVKGSDGTYRIARVTQIVPTSVDPDYQATIVNQGVSIAIYRKVVRAELIRSALSDKIVANDTTVPTVQRHVLEIKMTQDTDPQTGAPITEDQVDVRHILYAPGTDLTGTPPPSTDPGWAAAKAKADATYQALLKDPTKFQDIAKKDSADSGSASSGGDIGWSSQAGLDPTFGAAIFAPGLVKDQILPPVKSVYGWHVIQFIGRRQPARTQMDGFTLDLAKPGADFGAIAKANSTADDAATGGDMGWVARDQFKKAIEDAIYAVPIGSVSPVIVDGTDLYLFKVTEEQTRLPDGNELATLQSSAFTNWYTNQTAAASIDIDPTYAALLNSGG